MDYYSKKRDIKKFFNNKNIKYYSALIIIFLFLLAIVVSIDKKHTLNTNENVTTSVITTPEATTSENIVVAKGVYSVKINIANGQIDFYEYNSNLNDYNSEPSKSILCSYNSDFIMNEYTSDSNEYIKTAWQPNTNGGFYRFYSSYGNGLNFHSCEYTINGDKNSLNVTDYNNIGSGNSIDGFTMNLADAKWVYENCAQKSIFKVYYDETIEVSEQINNPIVIPDGITWDPTDDSTGSPWCLTEIQSLEPQYDTLNLDIGTNEDILLNYITATDIDNNSVVSYVYTSGNYSLVKAGQYQLTYNLIDIYGNFLSKTITLNIKDNKTTEMETTTSVSSNTSTETSSIEETTTASK